MLFLSAFQLNGYVSDYLVELPHLFHGFPNHIVKILLAYLGYCPYCGQQCTKTQSFGHYLGQESCYVVAEINSLQNLGFGTFLT